MSVVIAADDGAGYLGDAVATALQQSVLPLEVVVVDAGTPTGPAARLSTAVLDRFRYLPSTATVADGQAWAQGIEAARGDVIILLGPDEVLVHDGVEQHLEALEERPFVVGAVAELDARLEVEAVIGWEPDTAENLASRLALGEEPPVGAIAFHRSFIAELGFDPTAGGRLWHLHFVAAALAADRVVTGIGPVAATRPPTGYIEIAPEETAAVIGRVLEAFAIEQLTDAEGGPAAMSIGMRLLRLEQLEAALACFEVARRIAPDPALDEIVAVVSATVEEMAGEPSPAAPMPPSEPSLMASVMAPVPPPEPSPMVDLTATTRARAGSLTLAIITYQDGEVLGDALRSVLHQSRRPDEILVVDDGSTDGTAELLTAFPDVRVVRQANGGRPVARNTALTEATGEFLMWMDADDLLEPWAVERHRSVIDADPDVDVVYGDLVLVDDRSVPIRVQRYEDWAGRNAELMGRLLLGNEVPNGSSAFRRSMLLEAGGYDERFRRVEDYDMLTRIAPRASFRHSGDVVLRYRVSDEVVRGVAVEDGDGQYVLTAVHGLLARHPLAELAPTPTADPTEAEATAALSAAVRLTQLGDLQAARSYAGDAVTLVDSPVARELVATLDGALAEGLPSMAPLDPVGAR